MNNKKSDIVNRILGFSLSSWVNCLISFIATPIITALFPPEELGQINLFLSYTNIIFPFIYMGIDQAFVRYFNEPMKENDTYSFCKICICQSSFIYIIISIIILYNWKELSAKIIGYNNLALAISVIVFLFGVYIMRYMSLVSRMENNIGMFTIQSITITIITKISFIIIVIVKPVAEYAIIFRSIMYCVIALIFLAIFIKNGSGKKMKLSKTLLMKLYHFSIPLFPTTFLVMLNSSLPQIMLKKYVDYEAIGIYSNAVTIAGIIIVIQSGLNSFWIPFVYEYYKTEQKKLQLVHHVISLCMIEFAIILMFCQNPIYNLLVNKQYWESKGLFAILLISPVCSTISETLGIGIELSTKTYLKLPVYIIDIIINYISCVVLLPKYGVVGAALAAGISSMAMLITKAYFGEKYYECSDNYKKLIIGMIFLSICGLSNYILSDRLIKYSILLSAFIAILFIYKREFLLILRYGKLYVITLLRQWRKKKNNKEA